MKQPLFTKNFEAQMVIGEHLAEEIGKSFAAMKHNLVVRALINRNLLANIDDILNFDSTIIDVTRTGALEQLQLFLNNAKDIFKSQSWCTRVEQTESKIKDLLCLPEKNSSLALPTMYKAYQVEQHRLMHPVSQKEFADKLEWSKSELRQYRRRNLLPSPVYNVAASLFWTTGQVENFRRLISGRKTIPK